MMQLIKRLRQGTALVLICGASLMNGNAAAESLAGFIDGLVPETVDAAVEQITEHLKLHDCTVERIIDHAKNARDAGLSMNDTKLVLFSDPVVDESLISRNPLTALDLPQKILIRVDADGHVRINAKPGSELFNRHDVRIADRVLRRMSRRTQAFAADPGIINYASKNDFAVTLSKLQDAISDPDSPFRLAGKSIDYSVYAGGPVALVIAGAPQVGTRLMLQRPSIGLDLPLKFLVWEDDEGTVNLSYNDPGYLGRRYDLEGPEVSPILERMGKTLEAFAQAAVN